MIQSIILTTGVYDMIKDQVRRRKVTPTQSEILTTELRHARQVRRRELPPDVVDVNSRVRIRFTDSGIEATHIFVQPGKAKQKHASESILSPMGIALVGYPAGARVKWPFTDGEQEIEILEVVRF